MTNNSGFDLDAFMSTTIDSPMATYNPPAPEGEVLARVGDAQDDLKVESIQGKKDPTKTYVKITMMWDVIDEAYKLAAGRDKIRVRDSFLLDTENGQLKTGPEANVALGSRRAALGLNDGSFNINMLRGAGPAMIRISHRADPNDNSRKYAEVSRVAPLGR
jgi:hypothetical protein